MAFDLFNWFLTDHAQSDLDNICEYITFELDNPVAAASFVTELEMKVEEVCKTPKAGRLLQNPFIKRNDIRRILVKNFIVYYLIDDDAELIAVLRIVYGRRQQNDILNNLT